jgi:two-component system, sensor histidine kinase and response regulator
MPMGSTHEQVSRRQRGITTNAMEAWMSDAAATPERSSAPDEPNERPLLLLAEDNLTNQKVAVAMLTSGGYQVDTVLNGAEAVRAAAAHAYDAILMDCQMPELNGYEATAAIRARDGAGRHTPIIAMTAGARNEDRERCLAEGMDSYLSKPVSKDVLLALVARSVGDAPIGAPAAPGPRQLSGDEITLDPAVFADLRVLAETADEQFLITLVDRFIADTEPLLLQLGAALEIGNAATVSSLSHSIKGSCGQLGGRRLALSCDRLERKATAGRLADGENDLAEIESDFHKLSRALTEQLAPPPTGSTRLCLT